MKISDLFDVKYGVNLELSNCEIVEVLATKAASISSQEQRLITVSWQGLRG